MISASHYAVKSTRQTTSYHACTLAKRAAQAIETFPSSMTSVLRLSEHLFLTKTQAMMLLSYGIHARSVLARLLSYSEVRTAHRHVWFGNILHTVYCMYTSSAGIRYRDSRDNSRTTAADSTSPRQLMSTATQVQKPSHFHHPASAPARASS